jgi:hypothetical protein
MIKQNLSEQLQYSSSECIYVITWENVLLKLLVPFRVAVLKDIGSLEQGQIVLVDKVKVTSNLTTVFIVGDSAYYFYYFDILID